MINNLENKYERYEAIDPYVNDRQKAVLEYIRNNQPLRVGDIAKQLKEYSLASIKKDVQYFVQEGLIEKIGQGRGTTYLYLGKGEEE